MKWFLLTMTLMMSGCSVFSPLTESDTNESVTSAPTVVPVSEVRVVQVRAPVNGVTRTDALIMRLDAAGCDFSGVRITEGIVRKGSGTLQIGCK